MNFFIEEYINHSVYYRMFITVGSTGEFNSQLETISCYDVCGHNGDMTVRKLSTLFCYVHFMISFKIIKNPGQLKFTDLPHGILFCQERPGILEGTHKSNFFTQSILWTLFPDASFLLSKASTQQN